MTIIDNGLEFSDGQTVTASVSTVSTNSVDLGTGRDIGPGEPLYLVVRVATVCSSTATDDTLTPKLETSSTSAFTASTTLYTGPATETQTLVAGYEIKTRIPDGTKQFLRMRYSTSSAFSGGSAVDSYLALTPDSRYWD